MNIRPPPPPPPPNYRSGGASGASRPWSSEIIYSKTPGDILL